MTPAVAGFLDFLWRLCKIGFEIFVLDLLASFFDGYRNTRWRYQEKFAAKDWAR